MAKDNAKKGQQTRNKLKGHFKVLAEIWKAFARVAEITINKGAEVWIEGPKGCAYWNHKKSTHFSVGMTSMKLT